MISDVPPPDVLAAFGLTGRPVPLPGGEGRTVRVGDAVLKPAGDPGEAEWSAGLFAALPASTRFRVPRPIRSADGYVVGGWTASDRLVGETGAASRWADLLAAGRAFHRALRGVPRPDLLDRRDHRWARADRLAWDDAAAYPGDPADPAAAIVTRLAGLRRPVALPSQLVHGDLTGNVLFANGAPPAIIDFSPYWRPVGYADAIVVADGLLYHGAGTGLLDIAAVAPQLLVRALLFRLLTLAIAAGPTGTVAADEVRRFTHATALVEVYHSLA